MTRNRVDKIVFVKFWFYPSDPTVFPGEIIPVITKSNCIFPGKARGDKNFILTCSDSSMAEVFLHCYLFFSILTIFRTKTANFGSVPFPWILESFKNFQTVFLFLFARILPLVRISAMLKHIGGARAQKPPKKGYFVDAESVRKTLENFNLTTTNAILMKLTKIMVLHEGEAFV